ncbi:MAG: methylmalonyl Co-A mutase-associated GTPase MeaB [Terriglobia bacterium]
MAELLQQTFATLASGMTNREQFWADRIFAGDRRAIARAISSVENNAPESAGLLRRLFPRSGNAFIVGVTGSPGVGKSTLVEKLAGSYRAKGTRVGIVAVDPSSPFSGGAILGDRIRMQALFADEGVFIRSMATRGHLGGLAPAAQDVVTILDAAGCRVILIETVGVGQDEVEVARHADATILLLVPGMGDEVQTFKAGVMEIADLFVINKADRPGTERVEQEVAAMLSLAPRVEGWQPPVLRTVATAGEGVEELREALDQFRQSSEQSSLRQERQREQWRARLLELLRQRLFETALAGLPEGAMDSHLAALLARQSDPHSVVDQLIAEFRQRSG